MVDLLDFIPKLWFKLPFKIKYSFKSQYCSSWLHLAATLGPYRFLRNFLVRVFENQAQLFIYIYISFTPLNKTIRKCGVRLPAHSVRMTELHTHITKKVMLCVRRHFFCVRPNVFGQLGASLFWLLWVRCALGCLLQKTMHHRPARTENNFCTRRDR